MIVAGIQHDIAWEDPAATHRLVHDRIAAAADAGAGLIALSEMFSTGFSMAAERIAQPVDGPSATFLVEAAARHGVTVCASIPTRAPELARPVNRLLVARPDGSTHHYDKIHPFSYAGEDEHYEAGRRHVTIDIDGVRTSLFVCYDLRFADEFWAVAPETDLYVLVANWPAPRRMHWQTLVRARAIENQAYVLAVNRVGTDGNGLAYAGDSALVDPTGTYVATAPDGEEAVVTGCVDPTRVADIRTRFPFLQDRRALGR